MRYIVNEDEFSLVKRPKHEESDGDLVSVINMLDFVLEYKHEKLLLPIKPTTFFYTIDFIYQK